MNNIQPLIDFGKENGIPDEAPALVALGGSFRSFGPLMNSHESCNILK